VAGFDEVPASYVEEAKGKFRIFYGRTSHGTQVQVGMDMIASSIGAPYEIPEGFVQVVGKDLGYKGDLAWVEITRSALSEPGSDINVVMWSWCSGVTGNTMRGIQAYLDAMDKLEQEYPSVRFIYMTGHTNRRAVANTRSNNQQIREYCAEHGKVLFDFEDIESWDPDGKYYEDTGDTCPWCETWCASHQCPACDRCPHSHCFNCFNKGKAFWWMMARMAGWPGAA
jgi:hypothetical protein